MSTATKATHTPGPWSNNWIIRGSSHIDGHRANGEPIPSLRRAVAHIINRDAEAEANLNLIAAAPEMLEALEELISCRHRDRKGHAEYEIALDNCEAAIQKARGGQ